jgi:hypothetical protein
MTVWSWLKLTACLWLLRKAVKLAGGLLLALAMLAAWPLTLVTLAGYLAAWWRGWPPARLSRAAGWSLVLPAAWLAAAAVRGVQLGVAALAPTRAWASGWPSPAAAGLARTFALLAPVTVPAGLVLAAAVWAWRNYAITTGLGGLTATAPITPPDGGIWVMQTPYPEPLIQLPPPRHEPAPWPPPAALDLDDVFGPGATR